LTTSSTTSRADADARPFVVIPAFNEQNAIAATIQRLAEVACQIVVVDDGSSDQTWSVLETLPVHRLRHAVNLGQGAALQTGVRYALRQGAAWIVHFDADGQHRVEDIAVLLAPLQRGEADVALGSRFLRPEDASSVPPLRRLVLQTARVVNFLFTGVWLTDAHNGFRAMTRRAAELIDLKETGFAHATEILSEIRRHRLRYVECPTHIRYTDYSRGKGQKLTSAFNILCDLVLGKVFR
jgi:glycosyltransferase involved in cell wall biosynthesis